MLETDFQTDLRGTTIELLSSFATQDPKEVVILFNLPSECGILICGNKIVPILR